MKKFTILIPTICLSIASFGQTKQEISKIIATYDHATIAETQSKIDQLNSERQLRISQYLQSHPDTQIKYSEDHGSFMKELYDIVNNKPVYISTDNTGSAASTRTNFIQPGGALGLDLEGNGMHVATWDGGPTLATHQEFQSWGLPPITSRVSNPDLSASNDQSNHSTHVSGTIIAKGTNTSAQGMARKATLTSYDWDYDNEEVLNEATNNGLLLSNHSYGVSVQQTWGTLPASNMGTYNADAALWDAVCYAAPYYLMVVSAGNDGNVSYTGGTAPNYDKLTGNKNCKNNLVIANGANPLLNPNGSGTFLNMFINSSSSQGPSDDGRIKPDITGDGTNVFSSISTSNTSYATYSGTSMAAPNVTGTLLLLQEYYNQLHGNFMRASTLKGLVCHTATDDNSNNGPDAIFGWGYLNAKYAAETITAANDGTALIIEGILLPGQTYTGTLTLNTSAKLSATLCWTDPSGSAIGGTNSTTPALVNDLDLKLTKGGTTYYPYKLNPASPSSYATKTSENNVDTVERVDINNAATGDYDFEVSHDGSLTNGQQHFSLVITGFTSYQLATEIASFQNAISVYPNPASDLLYIKSDTDATINNIALYDISGRQVLNAQFDDIPQNVHTIDVKNLNKGLYILTVSGANGSYSKKITIE